MAVMSCAKNDHVAIRDHDNGVKIKLPLNLFNKGSDRDILIYSQLYHLFYKWHKQSNELIGKRCTRLEYLCNIYKYIPHRQKRPW